jgi:hypothetical protein
MLASGTQVRGFKPGWSCRIFLFKKILSMPSFGGAVKPSVSCRRFSACKRSLHLPWKSHAVGKIGSAISRPYFLPSLIEVSHITGRGAPLEMTGKTKSGAQRARSYGLGASGLQGPGSAPTLLYYSTLAFIVYDKLLKPRQSFWIILYILGTTQLERLKGTVGPGKHLPIHRVV